MILQGLSVVPAPQKSQRWETCRERSAQKRVKKPSNWWIFPSSLYIFLYTFLSDFYYLSKLKSFIMWGFSVSKGQGFSSTSFWFLSSYIIFSPFLSYYKTFSNFFFMLFTQVSQKRELRISLNRVQQFGALECCMSVKGLKGSSVSFEAEGNIWCALNVALKAGKHQI